MNQMHNSATKITHAEPFNQTKIFQSKSYLKLIIYILWQMSFRTLRIHQALIYFVLRRNELCKPKPRVNACKLEAREVSHKGDVAFPVKGGGKVSALAIVY